MVSLRDFYYKKAQSGDGFKKNPPGVFNVIKCLKNQACWGSRAFLEQDASKHVIIADWTARNWSWSKRSKLVNELHELLNKGFVISIYLGKQLIPLTKNNLDLLKDPQFCQIPPENKEEILKQNPKFSKDGTIILDEQDISQWLKENTSEERSLKASDYQQLSPGERDKVLELLNKATPPITQLIHDNFSAKTNAVMDELKKKFPELKVVTAYQVIEPPRTNVDGLVVTGKFWYQNEPYVLENYEVRIEDLRNAETISCPLKTAVYTSEVQHLLEKAPQLKKLELSHCKSDGYFKQLTFAKGSLPHLESLSLLGNFPKTDCKILLSACPSLKTLDLSGIQSISPEHLPDEIAFEKLEELTICLNNLESLTALENLVNACPNLRVLRFSNFNLSGKEAFKRFSQLKHLDKIGQINFDKKQITSELINSLLCHGSNLRKIRITNCNQLTPSWVDKLLELNNLEALHLGSVAIDDASLESILTNAKFLQELYLRDCGIGHSISLSPRSLLHLENLELGVGTLSTLSNLFRAAPFIKGWSIIGNNEQIFLKDIPAKAHLSHLNSLVLDKAPIDAGSLAALLSASSALKEMHFFDIQAVYNNIELSAKSLLQLELLGFESNQINSKCLKTFLEAAPNINSLRVSDNNNFTTNVENPHYSLQKHSLLNLKVIKITTTNISSDNFKTLIEAAPNVEKLNLSYSVNFHVGLQFSEKLTHLSELDLSNTFLTSEELIAFLKVAPNLKVLNLSTVYASVSRLTENDELEKLLEKIPVVIGKESIKPKALAPGKIRSAESPPAVRPHDPEQFKNYVPEKKEFVYKGNNKFFNQGMIIEKLSQYLLSKKTNLDAISRIQNGICNALSHFFAERSSKQWHDFLDRVSSWDGQQGSLTPTLNIDFNDLWQAVRRYQFSKQAEKSYLGDNSFTFLQNLPEQQTVFLANPWHAIAVRRITSNQWEVYDPNSASKEYTVNQEKLRATIKHSLGNLIVIEKDPIPPVKINDVNQFLQEGGLLLLRVKNYKEILQQLKMLTNPSLPALDGLFMCNTQGVPAWALALKHHDQNVVNYVKDLLHQFQQQSLNHGEKIGRSLKNISNDQRHTLLESLLQNNGRSTTNEAASSPAELQNQELIDLINLSTDNVEAHYEKILRTWDRKAEDNSLPPAVYWQQCVQTDIKKRLIKMESNGLKKAALWSLEEYCHKINRPCYVIREPNDLTCLSTFVSYNAQNKTGEIKEGYGGAFYDFLQAHKEKEPLILVDYNQFSTNDLIQFNTLLDKERKIDGAKLPQNAIIVGFMDTSVPNCYQGSDFYSRFDKSESCPIDKNFLEDAIPPLPIDNASNTDNFVINLFHASDWENQLLGYWVLEGSELRFREGKLAEALAQNKIIEIQNAPWEDDSFVQFWRSSFLYGEIKTPISTLKIPPEIKITKSDFYDWSKLTKRLILRDGLSTKADKTLNPSTFDNFFGRYTLHDEGNLKILPGYIEEKSDGVLEINLNRALNRNEWARLLDACGEKVKLVVHCAPGVELPEELAPLLIKKEQATVELEWSKVLAQDQIIKSSEPDTTTKRIRQQDPKAIVIDVRECTYADLVYHLSGSYNKKNKKFEFSGYTADLINKLAKNNTIVLKGKFSAELKDSLADVLLQRQKNSQNAGRLIVVTEELEHFNFTQPINHTVTEEDKYEMLGKLSPSLTERLKPFMTESLSSLQARLRYWQLYPKETDSAKAWSGLYEMPPHYHEMEEFDAQTSERKTKEFTNARRDAINHILADSPFVFLTGLSGVGKSTFVKKDFRPENSTDKLYLGEKSIRDWALDQQGPERKILFIDEANLSQKQFSEFEGLFNNPPSILIDGQLHILQPQHKVIFAGNPLIYGDERKIAPFFSRHGNTLVFDLLPPAFIYEKILKPVFANTALENQVEEISQPILKVYEYLCHCSTNDVLITPRELQMMALLILTAHRKNPGTDLGQLSKKITYDLAFPLVPENHRAGFVQLLNRELKKEGHLDSKEKAQKAKFVVTESRGNLLNQLDSLLDLCEWRAQQHPTPLNDAQKFGGLGGIIIEGSPGIGKSKLIKNFLIQRGYQQLSAADAPKEKSFYYIPASLSYDEKVKILMKAFDGGTKVIMEEMNSSPMMENLLNSLLMGETPDNKRPNNPGFMVFGTQNPITMAGRRAASPALARRLITTTLPEYSASEMRAILVKKGLKNYRAELMIKVFKKQLQFARKNNLHPEPNFRDLMKLAKQEIKKAENNNKAAQKYEEIKPIKKEETSITQLIKKVKDYDKNKNFKGLTLPFQFTKEQKINALTSFNKALEVDTHFIRLTDEKALMNGTLFKTIQHALEKDFPLLHSEFACEPPVDNRVLKNRFQYVEQLIHFLNQRNPKETLLGLLREYKALREADKTQGLFGLYSREEKLSAVAHLIDALENNNGASVSKNDEEALMQGRLGSVIKEFIRSYNFIKGNEKINSIQDLVKRLNDFTETPIRNPISY